MRLRDRLRNGLWRRYDVFDVDGQCAGNLPFSQADRYARGRASLLAHRGRRNTTVVVRRQHAPNCKCPVCA